MEAEELGMTKRGMRELEEGKGRELRLRRGRMVGSRWRRGTE